MDELPIYTSFGINGFMHADGSIDIRSVDILPVRDNAGNIIGTVTPVNIDGGKVELQGTLTLPESYAELLRRTKGVAGFSLSVGGTIKDISELAHEPDNKTPGVAADERILSTLAQTEEAKETKKRGR